MTTLIATGLSTTDRGPESFVEAAGRAAQGLGGRRVDLAVVFAGAPSTEYMEAGVESVHDALQAPTLIGCAAQGVVGDGLELEHGGVAVWAASLPPEARAESFHLETVPVGENEVTVAGMPSLEGAEAVILLVDPYTFPVEPVLAEIGGASPGLPVIGGLASAAAPGKGTLLHGADVVAEGAVGVALSGVEVRPCVSQGARPIGPEMVVTEAEGNVVHSLASRPALTRLKEVISELEPAERTLAMRGLLIGIVIDENQPEYDRGDFLIRGLLGVDEDAGSITLGEQVRVGQTVRLQVRDGPSADEDLKEALGRQVRALGAPPAGALLFTCNGRGAHMFGTPHHDASALGSAFSGAPAAGFFCAGEIGPVGDRNFVHGFTATLALFRG